MLRQSLFHSPSISLITLLTFFHLSPPLLAQQRDLTQGIPAVVDFSQPIRDWDGFGINYMETANTRDYASSNQDVGGFSLLDQQKQDEVSQLIFGEDGLQVGLVKMHLDPFHQSKANGKFDHETSTKNMRAFVRQGLDLTRARGADLSMLSTLLAPPAYMTRQKQIGARDLNPKFTEDLAEYMIDWVSYLHKEEKLPVDVISLHNGGNQWQIWDGEGNTSSDEQVYNLYWPPEQVVELIKLMPPILTKEGLEEVKISNGEPKSWKQFSEWGSAQAIYADDDALNHLGLVSSQGLGTSQSEGLDLLRSKQSNLHAWTTASSWGDMDANFVRGIHDQIYSGKVNGIIPELSILRSDYIPRATFPSKSAILVNPNGTYYVQSGYYFYKQLSRAGQAGTSVVRTSIQDSDLSLIGFGQNGSNNPDAFVLINGSMKAHDKGDGVDIRLGQAVHHFNFTDPKLNYSYRRGETSPDQQRKSPINPLVQYAKRRTKSGYILEVGIPIAGGRGQTTVVSRNLRSDVTIHDRSFFHDHMLRWNDKGAFKVSSTGGGNATYIDSPPKIDGSIDEIWESAILYPINSPESSGFRTQIRAMNTDQMLYFLIDVADPSPFGGREVAIEIKGSAYSTFEAFRTTDDGETYTSIGTFTLEDGVLRYPSPSHSVTTFYGIK